jgi:hypothetical protein
MIKRRRASADNSFGGLPVDLSLRTVALALFSSQTKPLGGFDLAVERGRVVTLKPGDRRPGAHAALSPRDARDTGRRAGA